MADSSSLIAASDGEPEVVRCAPTALGCPSTTICRATVGESYLTLRYETSPARTSRRRRRNGGNSLVLVRRPAAKDDDNVVERDSTTMRPSTSISCVLLVFDVIVVLVGCGGSSDLGDRKLSCDADGVTAGLFSPMVDIETSSPPATLLADDG